jgi:hypothetical protein
LHDEVRNHAPVVFVHARPIGVEDARDAHLDPVLARVADGQRLCAPAKLAPAVASVVPVR